MTNTEIIERLICDYKLVEAGQAALYLKDENTYKVRAAIESLKRNPTFAEWDIYENLLLADAQEDFDCFCRFLDFGVNTPVRQFYLPRRHYLKPVADALMRVESNETEVLRVQLIKRSGKTELVLARYMSWHVGRNPFDDNLGCVGGATLANSLFRKVKTIWDEYGEQYLKVFPGMSITKMNNEDRILWVNRESEYGNITIVSIDGNFEGRVQATGILLIDDIVTNEVSKNKVLMAKQYEIDVLERLMGRRVSGNIVIVGTPVSPHDALERLYIDMERAGSVCEKVSIPALNEKGESVYAFNKAKLKNGKVVFERENTTEEFLKKKRIAENSHSPVVMASWLTTYMMNPTEAQGLVFPELQYWVTLPERFEREFAILDTKTRGSDYFVIFNMKVLNGIGYVTDIFLDNGDMSNMTKRVVDFIEQKRIINFDIETNSAGALYSVDIKKELQMRGYNCRVEEHYQTRNKYDRIMAAAQTITTEMFFDPNARGQYKQAIEQLQTYTADGKALNDDVADCAALASEKLKTYKKQARVIVTGRVF
jgi:predicted phage terminase large subunit-like protein